MKYTYLLINFFTIIVPFIFSFHPRLQFYKKWPALFPAMIFTGAIFIGWDMYFTSLGVWGFNPDYVTGIFFGNLPIEEIMFFFCIPYACLFTYASLNVLVKKDIFRQVEHTISLVLIVLSIVISACFSNHSYTSYTFVLLAMLILIARYLLKATWVSRFYMTYCLLLIPFLIVNGLLTGTGLEKPVVWYNPQHIINLRIFTIPLEDVFYGMALILLNIMTYSFLTNRIDHKRKNILTNTGNL
jgi:lycopene cyclase domain-containing protein